MIEIDWQHTEIKKSEKLFAGHLSTIRAETTKTLSSTLSFFFFMCVCVSFLLGFFLYLSRDKNTRKRDVSVERRRCARARFFRRAMMMTVVKC